MLCIKTSTVQTTITDTACTIFRGDNSNYKLLPYIRRNVLHGIWRGYHFSPLRVLTVRKNSSLRGSPLCERGWGSPHSIVHGAPESVIHERRVEVFRFIVTYIIENDDSPRTPKKRGDRSNTETAAEQPEYQLHCLSTLFVRRCIKSRLIKKREIFLFTNIYQDRDRWPRCAAVCLLEGWWIGGYFYPCRVLPHTTEWRRYGNVSRPTLRRGNPAGNYAATPVTVADFVRYCWWPSSGDRRSGTLSESWPRLFSLLQFIITTHYKYLLQMWGWEFSRYLC